jgi:hypothetical protein
MDPGTLFFKTEQGKAEVTHRSGHISPAQRRLLIMVDGKKSVNDLGSFAREGELLPSLRELQLQGLIGSLDEKVALPAPAASGFMVAGSVEEPRAATSLEEFVKVRQAASSFVEQKLGMASGPICAAIDRCKSPADLRKMLRGVEIFVSEKLSADAAQQFARHFGSLLV